MHLSVDLVGYLVTIILVFADLAAEEDEFLLLTECPRAQFLTHAVLDDHLPGQFSCLL